MASGSKRRRRRANSGLPLARWVEPRLGIDQKRAGGGDPVTGGEAVEDGK